MARELPPNYIYSHVKTNLTNVTNLPPSDVSRVQRVRMMQGLSRQKLSRKDRV